MDFFKKLKENKKLSIYIGLASIFVFLASFFITSSVIDFTYASDASTYSSNTGCYRCYESGYKYIWNDGTKNISGCTFIDEISDDATCMYGAKTISYNANGGTGAPGPQIKFVGSSLTLSSIQPTKSGYTFKGWDTSSNASLVIYKPGSTFSVDADTTLYAVWGDGSCYECNSPANIRVWSGSTPSDSNCQSEWHNIDEEQANCAYYTISYNTTGGSGVPSTVFKAKGVDITISDIEPTKTDYTFKGWDASSDASDVIYKPGSTFSVDADTTLYAVWDSVNSCYECNSPANIRVWSGSTPSDSNCQSEWHNIDEEQANCAYYTISYDAKGGTGAPSMAFKSKGVDITISNITPTKSGSTFKGWDTSSDGKNVIYNPGEKFSLDANTTLYAVWGDGSCYECNSPANIRVWSGSSNPSDSNCQSEWHNIDVEQAKCAYYTISYDAKGGTGAPSMAFKSKGVDITISNISPTKTGYTFKGWDTSSTGKTVEYKSGSTFSDDADTTLYAVWKEKTKYTVTYYSNIDGDSLSEWLQKTVYDGDDFIIENTAPSTPKYTFLGWSEDKDATSPEYYVSQNIGAINRNMSLYAVWGGVTTPTNPKYTVTYYRNITSVTANDVMKTVEVESGKQHTVEANIDKEKEGYIFKGWSTDENATTAMYSGADYFIVESNVDLYAVWEKLPKIEIRYYKNITLYDSEDYFISEYIDKPESYTITKQVPTRNGYKFLGWAENRNATTPDYQGADSFWVESDINLYAVWEKEETGDNPVVPSKIVVNYYKNINTNSSSDLFHSDVLDNAGVYVVIDDVPTRSGYKFLGWAGTKAANKADYSAGSSFYVSSNTNLYAVWEKEESGDNPVVPETYIVIYNANGGSGAPANQTKTHGVDLKLSSGEPTRVGYEFLGWGTSTNATTVEYLPGSMYKKDASITLYAIWNEINNDDIPVVPDKIIVKYNANGGIGAPNDQEKVKGVDLVLSNVEPTREGYVFLGWGISSISTEVSYLPGDIYDVDKSITLYAIWTSEQEEVPEQPVIYTVRYNANGGSGAPSEQVKIYGLDLTLSNVKPIRDGYIFKGWDTNFMGKTVVYLPGDIYKENTSMILYAVWEENTLTDNELDKGPQTGDTLIYLVSLIGAGALGYSVYYYMKKRNSI